MTEPATSRPTLAWLLALTGLALALRLYHLGHESLWVDEAATWWNATRPTWHDTIFAEGNHSPLWWIITRLCVGAFGDGEFALRLPAAILGALCVPLTWLLARAVARPGSDPKAATWVALLAALHPFWIEYAQEARMYAALLAESLGLSLLLLAWLDRPRHRLAVGYAALATAALYTHAFAALTLASHAVFVIVERMRRGRDARLPWRSVLFAQWVAVALFVPWLLRSAALGVTVGSQGHYSALERAAFALWRLLYGPSLATADRTRIDGGLAAFVRAEAVILAIGALLGATLLALGVRALRRHPPGLSFLACSILVPFAALIAIHARLPLLHEKYLIMTAPSLVIVCVAGARAGETARRFLLPALVVWIALATVAYVAPGSPLVETAIVHGHPHGKEQWREARQWVAARADSGAVVVLYPSFLDKAWQYYDRGRLAAVGLDSTSEKGPPMGTRPTRILLVSAAARGDLRQAVARDLAVWMAADTAASLRGGVVEQKLFPRQWGVWTYDIVRGRPPARMPE